MSAGETERWNRSIIVDFSAIEHRWRIGVVPCLWGEVLVVEIVRRDELDLDTRPASITPTPAEISVAGLRFSTERVRELARVLTRAADELDGVIP